MTSRKHAECGRRCNKTQSFCALVAALIGLLWLAPTTGTLAQDTAQPAPVFGSAARSGVSGAVIDLPAAFDASEQLQPSVAPREFRRRARASISDADAAVDALLPSLLMPNPALTFDGLSAADNVAAYGSTVAPPDTNGDVGPNHYVQFVNLLFRVYDKNGNALTAPTKLSSLFTSMGGLCATTNRGDVQVLYDPMADRWLLAQFAFTAINAPPYHMCVAVSQTGNPAGAYFVYDFVTPGNEFPDYPKFGVWPDGYYMTVNQFTNGGPFNGTGAYAFRRTAMLAGNPASFIYFNLNFATHPEGIGGMLPADLDGPNLPAAGSPNVFTYFTANEFGDPSDALRLFNFHADFVVPANSTFTERGESPIAVAAFSPNVNQVPQPSGSFLGVLADRLMFRQQYRNLGTNECLTNNHTVVGPVNQAAIRWHVLCKSGAGPYSLAAPGGEGTFAPDSVNRWMGSAALDQQGNLAVGYSAGSSAIHPQIRWAGRLSTDAPGTLGQGEAHMFDGTGSQVGTSNRWGDYSAMTVDPTDECTFWYTTEYYAVNSSFNWRTRIGNFKYPSCGGTSLPNLTVTKIVAPAKSGAGLNIAVKTTTLNNGANAAPASITHIYFSDNNVLDGGDPLLGSRNIPPLAPGVSSTGSTTVTIPPGATSGVHYLIAKADGPGAVVESNEGDNTLAKKITIGPDLRVTQLSAPGSAAKGSSIAITDTTKNTGGASTGVSTTTKLYLSKNTQIDGTDVPLGQRVVPNLAPNGASTATTNVTIPNTVVAGNYYIIGRADDADIVDETSEVNNKRSVAITITP